MPHKLVWEKRLVVKEFWGFVSGDEFAQSVEEVSGSPNFDELQFIVCDFLKVETQTIDASVMDWIAAIWLGATRLNPNIRVIVVATGDNAAWLADPALRGPLQGSYETIVVPRMDDARAWIEAQPTLTQCPPVAGWRFK